MLTLEIFGVVTLLRVSLKRAFALVSVLLYVKAILVAIVGFEGMKSLMYFCETWGNFFC